MNETRTELATFFRKLVTMLEVGVPLLRTLETIQKETSDAPTKAMIADLANNIREGTDMKTAMARHPGIFSPSVLTMIEVGETTGTLVKVLLDVAKGMEEGTLPVAASDAGTVSVISEKTPAVAAEEAPVLKLVSLVILEAVKNRASDIHLEAREDGPLRIRFRVDGVLHDADQPPAHLARAIITRIKIMANLNLQEKRRPQDGRIQVNVQGKDIDIRISVAPCITGESIVMRLLERASLKLPTLESQGFTAPNMATLQGWCRKPNGIIIITGPTGCGKTTTLYTLLQELNSPEIKIMTVEDPVEYQIEGICQMRVDVPQGVTFPQALRCQLRHDPDVIMIGEIRDLETIHIAVQMALTGHLVLTSIHTHDAPSALRRLMDIGLEPWLVSDTVIGVVSQTLVRKICPDCREEFTPEDWMKEAIKDRTLKSFRGKGCATCHNFGYRGRIGVHELLEMNEKVKAAVARDASLEELRRAALDSGMITKLEDGLAKAGQGITTIQEVLNACA